jgi:hypothetical protein
MMRHALTIAGLLGLSCAVQAWCVARAVTPAQDAVRFIKVAQAIEHNGLLTVLRTRDEHPLFPAAVCLTHHVRGLVLPEVPDAWATSAQLAAAAALVLTVVPVYGLLLCLTRWPSAAAGALFFCLMTPVTRLGADGLSDSTHLCLLCAALWATTKWFSTWSGRFDVQCSMLDVGRSGMRTEHRTSNIEHPTLNDRGNAPRFGRSAALFLAGLFLALAALARKEAVVLLPAIGLAASVLQLTAARRRWRDFLRSGLFLGLGMAVVVGPYLATSEALTPGRGLARLLGPRFSVESPDEPAATVDNAPPKKPKKASSRWRMSDGQRMEFAKKDSQASIRFHGYGPALRELARELPEALNYWIGGLALLGLWSARRRAWPPTGIFVLVFALVFSAAVIQFAARSGYLAPRHLLPLVVLALAWAGEGAMASAECGVRSAEWLKHRLSLAYSALRTPHSALVSLVVLLAAAACLPRTLAPLHASRVGHRKAAQWLASQPGPHGAVLDTRGFTRFFSGRKTYDFAQGRQALRDPHLAYVVVERRELEYGSRRSQTLRELLARGSTCVARFAGDAAHAEAVEVYQWPGNAPSLTVATASQRSTTDNGQLTTDN